MNKSITINGKRIVILTFLFTLAISLFPPRASFADQPVRITYFGPGSPECSSASRIFDCVFCNNGRDLVLADATESKLLVITVGSWTINRTISGIVHPISLLVDTSGNLLTIETVDRVYEINTANWRIVGEFPFPAQYAEFCSNGRALYAFFTAKPAYHQYNRMQILSKRSRPVLNISGKWDFDGGACLAPNGKYLIVGHTNFAQVIQVGTWRIEKTLSFKEIKSTDQIKDVEVSPDGKLVAFSFNFAPQVLIYRTAKWSLLSKPNSEVTPDQIQFGPGNQLYTFADPDGFSVWDERTGMLLNNLQPPDTSDVDGGQVSPDGKFVVILDWTYHAQVFRLK